MNNLYIPTLLLLISSGISHQNIHKHHESVERSSNPIKIEKQIRRFKSSDAFVVDSVSYQYDAKGNIMSITDLKTSVIRQKFAYANGKMAAVISDRGEVIASVSESNNGNKITVDYSRANPNGGIDTILLTYHFQNNLIQRVSQYVHLANFHFSDDKQVFKYNNLENLTVSRQVTTLNDSIYVSRVSGWDTNKNPYYSMNKYNFIFICNQFPFNCQSRNNPTKYIDYFGNNIDIDITYNAEGYPLTYKNKAADFIADEFTYDR